MHYFSRQLTAPKMLTSSLSNLISKLSSRRILFLPNGDKSSPIIEKSPSKSLTSKSARFKSIIGSLYKSLLTTYKPTSLDQITDYDHQIIASDLEWWFHGPPGCDYMMRMLTGQSVGGLSSQQFRFEPRNIEVVGDRVIVEGWEGEKVYWVHVWTVRDHDDDNNNGAMVITQFREYFNTWLTVKDVTGGGRGRRMSTEKEKLTLWRSQPGDVFERSLPGLVLAI